MLQKLGTSRFDPKFTMQLAFVMSRTRESVKQLQMLLKFLVTLTLEKTCPWYISVPYVPDVN
jgi:hypothetical protein